MQAAYQAASELCFVLLNRIEPFDPARHDRTGFSRQRSAFTPSMPMLWTIAIWASPGFEDRPLGVTP